MDGLPQQRIQSIQTIFLTLPTHKNALSVKSLEMDKSMNVEKISARQAAERWIAAHPEQVDSWRPK